MRAAYSEMLRRIQQEGLYQAGQQQRWRAEQLAERRLGPPEDAPEEALEDTPEGALEDAPEDAPEEASAGEGPPEASGTGPQRGEASKTQKPRAGRGWTSEDVVECRGCWYWRMLDYTLDIRACWYPLLENRLRPCLPADCYRKPGTPYRPCDPQGADREAGQGAAQNHEEEEGSD